MFEVLNFSCQATTLRLSQLQIIVSRISSLGATNIRKRQWI